MPKYRIPCWINQRTNFDITVEADNPTIALLNLHALIESNDPKDIDYVEDCVSSGEIDGYLNPVDFDDNTTNITIVE